MRRLIWRPIDFFNFTLVGDLSTCHGLAFRSQLVASAAYRMDQLRWAWGVSGLVVLALALGAVVLRFSPVAASDSTAPEPATLQTPASANDTSSPSAPAVQLEQEESGQPEDETEEAEQEAGEKDGPGGHQDPDGADVQHEFQGEE